jgi:hypothetical protein
MPGGELEARAVSREARAERRGMRDLLKDCGKLLGELRRLA